MNRILEVSGECSRVPHQVSVVEQSVVKFLPAFTLEYKTFQKKIRDKFILFECKIKPAFQCSLGYFLDKKYGLTIRIFQTEDYIGYEIYAYPFSTSITTEFGEDLYKGLKKYFKVRINHKINYYKRLKLDLKGK